MMLKKIILLFFMIVISGRSFSTEKTNSNFYKMRDGKKYMFFNPSNNKKIEGRFKDTQSFSENLAAVKIPVVLSTHWQEWGNSTWTFIDTNGNQITEPRFEDVLSFSEGLAAVKELPFKEKGEYIIPVRFPWGFIDNNGNSVIEPQYDDAKSFSEGFAAVKVGVFNPLNRNTKSGDKWGFIEKNGRFSIMPNFQSVQSFSESVAAVKEIDSDLWGFIDQKGNYLIKPQFAEAHSFSESKAAVRELSSNLWGYINKNGDFIIEPQFNDARSFSENRAAVKDTSTDHWGYINNTGMYAISPTFSSNDSDLPSPFNNKGYSLVMVDTSASEYYMVIDNEGNCISKDKILSFYLESIYSDGYVSATLRTENLKDNNGYGGFLISNKKNLLLLNAFKGYDHTGKKVYLIDRYKKIFIIVLILVPIICLIFYICLHILSRIPLLEDHEIGIPSVYGKGGVYVPTPIVITTAIIILVSIKLFPIIESLIYTVFIVY
jgi:hypothetical protein